MKGDLDPQARIAFLLIRRVGGTTTTTCSLMGAVVGRIMRANAAPVGTPWMWTLIFEHHKDRTPTLGYAETREAAMAAFAKRWRRE